MRVNDFKKWLRSFFADRVTAIMFSFTVLFFVCMAASVAFPTHSLISIAVNAKSSTPIGEIYDGQNLEMDFTCTSPSLSGISFATATYGRTLTQGTLSVRVSDIGGTEIFSREYPGASIKDNSTLDLIFPVQTGSKNEKYTVSFRTKGIDRSQAITFWANGEKPKGTATSVNGQILPYSLVFSIVCNSRTYRYTWDLFLLCDIFLVLTVVAYGRTGSIKKKEQGGRHV